MVQIAICDRQAGKYIESLLAETGQEFTLHRFEDTEKLLESEVSFDVVMLDGSRLREVAGRKKEPLFVKTGNRYMRVAREEVLYIESNGRKLIVHTGEQKLECYGRISDLEEKLGEDFYRCHRGYLVNLSAVNSYDSTSITVKNGEKVFLSRQKYHGFTERYAGYLQQKQEG